MAKEAEKKERTVDPASRDMLKRAEEMNVETAFSRSDEIKPCPIGQKGYCCRVCYMGPCRLTKPGMTGVCGATVETVVARNFARAIAAGASAHSDHGRDLALTLKAIARGETQGYQISDPYKLVNLAEHLGVATKGRPIEEVAEEVADVYLGEFGKQGGRLHNLRRAPKKRQKVWEEAGIAPRGVDREVVEVMHRTHIGNDQDPEHILDQGLRCALSDGWGGSMIGTDLTDVIFGTPSPVRAQANLGVISEDEVNILVHGHEPTLSGMILAACQDPELIEYAKSKGANGINLAGLCCTANELLMRQGISTAGNFLQQELAIMTGAIEAMVVDIQCIMQSLPRVAANFHTEVITTSPKAKITGATHVEFHEDRALDIAREIVRRAIDRFPERGETRIPDFCEDAMPGFSHEYINYMLGGSYRASFRPLNDAIMAGRIRGVVGNVGCNNPRVTHDYDHMNIVAELLKNDVLVVETGCGAIASAKYCQMTGESAMELAGPGLREVCETVGIPPVLHMGSCVDNSRILTVLSQMAMEGGLGDDISDIPAVGLAPEWMSEKAISIASYCAASGAYVIMGVTNPVEGSEFIEEMLSKGWEEKTGGKIEFVSDHDEIVRRTLEHIDKKRAALKLPEYDPAKFGESGDESFAKDIEKIARMPLSERAGALYGR